MNGIISIDAETITATNITTDIIKASNLLEADTPETISGLWEFTTLPYSSVSATTGTQFTNKTYVDSAITSSLTNYVTLSTTQTITGAKTINANLRLNNTRNLIFGTTTGAVMNFTGANMYYDNQAGGGHYFFISGSPNLYIDSTGLNIESGKRIWFNGARCSITDNGTQLVYDVPTGNSHSFRTNNTQRLTISADTNGTLFTFPAGTIMREYTSFNWFLYQLPAGHTLKYQVGGTDIMEVSNAGALLYESLSMRNGKRVVWDEGFTNIAYLRKDTTTSTLDYEVATGYSHKFMVNSVTQLLLNTSGATFTGGIFMKAGQPIYPDDTFLGGAITSGGSGGIRFDADTGGDFRFINDGTLALTINGTLITIPVNQELQFGATGSNITSTTTSLQYNVPTGSSHHFRVNSTIIGSISSTGLLFPVSNSTLTFGVANVCSITQNTASTAFRFEAPTGYTHRFRINSLTQLQVLTTGIQVTGGYYTKLGSGGAFQLSVFNNSWAFPNLTAWVDGTNIGNYTISDVRIKKNIVEARPVLDRLCKLSMIEYNYIENGLFKDDGVLHYGYIAQEIKKEFPEFPNLTIGEDTDMTDDGNIQPIRVNAEFSNLFMGAVIELNKKVEGQQKQIEAQQKVIEDQQKQIDQLLVLFSSRMV
jgi:hypothetical protein